ncbi:hypothetical protein EYF80_055108 [Liparis tanakae]|uniref:C-type lectin domain-containing protein n=1 Tax=Liparis tanakae TaxID=230148 RepID=A0A4Z2F0R1_9TELE|nr:hypothetical protein EYF80_055108 [Liparis tanakae]
MFWKSSSNGLVIFVFIVNLPLFTEASNYDRRYVYVATPMTWNLAQEYCRKHHTDLATIRNRNDLDALEGPCKNKRWESMPSGRITDDSYSLNLVYFILIFIFNTSILMAVASDVCKMKQVIWSSSAHGPRERPGETCRSSLTEHRAALKSGGAADWMEAIQKPNPAERRQRASREQNGQSSGKKTSDAAEATAARAEAGEDAAAPPERSTPAEQDKVQRVGGRSAPSGADQSRAGPDQSGAATGDKARWVQVTVAVGEEGAAATERPRPAAGAEVPAMEQPGRLTG